MCKRTILLTLVMVLSLLSFASAAYVWDNSGNGDTPGGGNNQWLTCGNWMDNQCPINADADTAIQIAGGMAKSPNQCEVSGVVDIDLNSQPTRIQFASAGAATSASNRDTLVIKNGGELLAASFGSGFELMTSGGFSKVVVQAGGYAGPFSYMGAQGGNMLFEINGGMLEGSWQLAAGGASAVVRVELNGGTLKCEPINVNASTSFVINITGGTLNTSDSVAKLTGLVNTGNIIAAGGTNPRAYIAIANPGRRIVTAVIPSLSQAYAPTPFPPLANTVVNIDQVLSWSAGDGAVSHKVYLGADEPNNMVLVQSSTALTYTQPGLFDLGVTYYWRVDEVQSSGPDVTGSVWAFSTLAYIAIEDFESYDATGTGSIGYTWSSGTETWESGSTVALSYDPVRGGEQAMQFDYDNSAESIALQMWPEPYSESTRSLVADFTPKSSAALFISVMGDPCNAADRVYVRIADGSTSVTKYLQVRDLADPNHTATNDVNLLDDSWQTAMIDLSTLGVVLTDIQSITLGVGDKDNPVATGTGTIYVDDIQLRTSTCVYGAPGADLSGDCRVDLADFGIFAGQWLDSGMWP